MHIHNYQIHNVLNLYRQRLRKNSRDVENLRPSDQADTDKQISSGSGQRQVIMDTISEEIIDRISRYGPQSEFNEALNKHLRRSVPENQELQQHNTGEFTYILIDEHNRKRTNSLRLQEFSPLFAGTGQSALASHQRTFGIEED